MKVRVNGTYGNGASTPNSRRSPKSARVPQPASCVGFGVPEAGIKKYLLHFARKGLPTVYQAHFWLSKQGSNSVRFLSMAQAT